MAAGLTAELVELGDLDELTRLVDRICQDEDWSALVDLRDRCRAAVQRGKQLWPVAAHAEYRLALEAPGRWAARVLEPGAGRFALGPLTEVAASTHGWDELGPHVRPGAMGTLAAHERVVRGEDLRGHEEIDGSVLELPLVLQLWEPDYPLAEYAPDRAHFPAPALPPLTAVDLPAPAERVHEVTGTGALVDLAAAWTTESNGRAEAVAVRGEAVHAVAALGPPRARMAELSPANALATLAWAGASGGAHGRRRGMATGRFAAWWAVACLANLADRWPVPPARLGEAAGSLRWFAWDAGEPAGGWSLRLAVEHARSDVSLAVSATDAA
jgi:hypothetical protein